MEPVNRAKFPGEHEAQVSASFSMGVQGRIEVVLRFIGRAVSNCAMQAFGGVQGDAFQGFPLELGYGLPGPQGFDNLGFEQAADVFTSASRGRLSA